MDYTTAQGAPLGEAPDFQLFQKHDAGDESLFVIFYMGVLVDEEASKLAGRRIARDAEFIKIIVPGDRNNVIDQPAQPHDIRRFPRQYAAFQAGKKNDEQLVGTRLSDWPPISRAQVVEFEYLGIKTVEQLSELRDDVVARLPGSRDLKAVAKSWLGRAHSAAEATQAVAEKKALEGRIAELQEAIKEQGKIIEQLREDRVRA